MSRPVALITGPTSGIGAGFARALAARDHDVVLVARDTDKLAALAEELRTAHLIEAEVLAADLALAEGRAAVAARLADGVDVLINNAGFGTSGEFWSAPEELLKAQLDVNVTAVMELTRAAMPAMIERGRGQIVNVASVAGLISGRGSTYSASRAWVVSFYEGLDAGLAGTGVRIMALCPGFVRTEFHSRAGIEMSTMPSAMWLSVDQVVDTGLRDLAAGKAVSVPGLQYKALTAASRMIPRGLARAVAGRVGRARGRT